MFELKKEVKTYMVSQLCDCGGAFQYESNGITLTTYPPQYPHVCYSCGKINNFDCIYPKIEYEYID